jgi:tetratricopeptide (TPR) repeat protein
MKWNVAPSKEEIALLMEAGFIYRDARRFQEARDVFQGVRALAPSSEVPEVALGTVAFHEADFAAAAKHYKRALDLNPSSAYAYAHLGELSLFQKDKDAARVHLKKAVELDHPRGEIRKLASSLLELTDAVTFKG